MPTRKLQRIFLLKTRCWHYFKANWTAVSSGHLATRAVWRHVCRLLVFLCWSPGYVSLQLCGTLPLRQTQERFCGLDNVTRATSEWAVKGWHLKFESTIYLIPKLFPPCFAVIRADFIWVACLSFSGGKKPPHLLWFGPNELVVVVGQEADGDVCHPAVKPPQRCQILAAQCHLSSLWLYVHCAFMPPSMWDRTFTSMAHCCAFMAERREMTQRQTVVLRCAACYTTATSTSLADCCCRWLQHANSFNCR